MPRLRVIVLEQEDVDRIKIALWADVPVARQRFYARPAGTVSAWVDALPGDNTNLINGSVAEMTFEFSRVGLILAQIRALVESRWQQWQTLVTSENKWVRYGTTWDGTTWVAGGVA